MKSIRYAAALGCALLAAAAVAEQEPAQQDPAARFEERVKVIEVLVDVLATDRRGRVVTGLTVDDFEVEENGEPREVTSVAFYTTRYEDLPVDVLLGKETPAAPEGFPPTHLPASRYFVFFFHDQTMEVLDPGAFTSVRLQAARDARRWLETEMQPSDWIAVVRYDHRLLVQCDFTQDRAEILAAVDAASLNRRTGAMRPSVRDRREAARAGPSLTAGLPNSFDLEKKTIRIEHAVQVVAEALEEIVGRKNLVLFTLGFGRIESPLGSPDERYYPAMEAALNDANVAVYPIDLAGSSNRSPQNNFLSQLADETGGIYFSTFHSFLGVLSNISEYNTGYYLLSFRSEVPVGETGYRTFKLKAKDRKVRVKARRGYRFGSPDDG